MLLTFNDDVNVIVPTANPFNGGAIVYLTKLLLVTHNAFAVSLKGLI
jgi:hypothetical protein